MKRICNCIEVLHRFTANHYNSFNKETGISGPQYYILPYVFHHEGCHLEEISAALHYNKSNVTRQIEKLEKAGLVEIRPDPQDGRARCLFATPEAVALIPQIRTMKVDWNEQMTSSLTEEEKEILLMLLNKALDNVKSLEAEK